jgi:hypothetical protein
MREMLKVAAIWQGHLIIRHLGVCQLSQALHGVITNPATLNQMVDAWQTIDFEAIRNQAALVRVGASPVSLLLGLTEPVLFRR